MTYDQVISLATALLIPAIIVVINKKWFNNTLNKVSIAALSGAVLYVILLVSVFYISQKIETELASFDLDGDGFFSGNEITEEQQQALKRFTQDTGRNFAPFTGIAVSVVYFLCVWLSLYLAVLLKFLLRKLIFGRFTE